MWLPDLKNSEIFLQKFWKLGRLVYLYRVSRRNGIGVHLVVIIPLPLQMGDLGFVLRLWPFWGWRPKGLITGITKKLEKERAMMDADEVFGWLFWCFGGLDLVVILS